MLTIPEEIKNLFRSDNITAEAHKKFRLEFYNDTIDSLYPYETLFPEESLFPSEHGEPWLVIENDRIVSETLQITEALSSDEDLVFGSCEGAELQITVADVNNDITGKEFTLIVEIGGYEMSMGIYTVESFVRQSDRRRRKITAYDRMRWFDVDVATWYNNLSFPMTLKNFRDSLCSYIGISQNNQSLILDSMQVTKTIDPEELAGTDVLKAICEINGCFGHVDKTGMLKYIYLQQTGLYPSETLYPEESLYPTEYGGDGVPTETISTFKQPMTYEDYLVEGIDSITIRQEEGDVGASVGEGNNVYIIEGNFLVYGKSAQELLTIAQSILPYIEGRVYRPASLDCNGMPWVEVGDAIVVPTKDDLVETFVMNRTTSGCQAMRDKIEATGNEIRENDFTLNKKIIQLEGKSAVITKNVEEVSVRVTNLQEYTESQFSITAGQIQAEVTRATEAEGQLSSRITLNADSITAEVQRATNSENSLSSRITVNAQQIELKVSKGDVSSQISVESGRVTISGNRLVVDSSNFKLDQYGNATFGGTLDSAGGTFNGDVLINGFSESYYPLKLKNSANAYFGIGGTGFLLAKSGYYIKLDYDIGQSMPRLYMGTYSSIDDSTFAMTVSDNLGYFDADGAIKSVWTRRHSTEDEANIHISSEGYFYRVSSSSKRYKENISDNFEGMNPNALYNLPVVTFTYKDGYLRDNDPNIGKKIIGFLAEDVLNVFPSAVSYENGVPETWKTRIMIPSMLKLIQEQNDRLKILEEWKNENTYL